MKVLVTGGAGFIGSHLIGQLVKRGYEVSVFDNLWNGKIENIAPYLKNGVEFVQGDIRDEAAVDKCLKGVDSIVHLAALVDVSESVAHPDLSFSINVGGTLNLLKEASKCGLKRFVFASSTAVYGDARNLPIREDAVLNPISPYAASKAAGEAYCETFQNCYGLSTVILRFFNVYGPRSEKSPYSGVITKFLQQAKKSEELCIFGDGKQTRDFIHVNDVVAALISALNTEKLDGQPFNVCTGVPISVNALAEAVSVSTGNSVRTRHLQARPGEIRFSYGDPSRAAEKLNFKAKIDLQEGLGLLVGHQAR